LNARFLEGIPQTAMLGRAIRNSPLMERSIVGLSDKAVHDAAQGLQATENQVQLARAVQRAYGKYSNLGPALRETVAHWTPFVLWALSATRFLASVLPKDHPLISGLIADADKAEEDWRKAHGLSLRTPDHVPFYLLGSYPTHGGRSLTQIGHYTPLGVAQNPTGDLTGAVLPQFSSAYGAVQYGVDWKGKALENADGTPYDDGQKWLYALTQLGEAMVPLSAQTANVASAQDKVAAIRKQFRLVASSASHRETSSSSAPLVNVAPIKVKPV
jgi:hypothetical protein